MNGTMDPNEIKPWVEIVLYLVTIIGGPFAIWTYWKNQSLERSRWASSLYEKFYEEIDHKGIRRELDCSAGSEEVAKLVDREPPEFTDYLNFFEHVAYLIKCKQIKRADAEAYFGYYLACLKQHPAVLTYVRNKAKGYEYLAELIGR
jgi:predicted negative regulator of RcsB-dependent stress response